MHMLPTVSFSPAAGGVRLRPTLITYNTLISACGKGGLYEEANELYASMGRQVSPVCPPPPHPP